MSRIRSPREQALHWLHWSLMASCGTYLLMAGGFGITGIMWQAEASRATSGVHKLETEAEALKEEVGRAKNLQERSTPSDLGAASDLRASIGASAKKNNCAVIEFRASSELLPYLTRFSKENKAIGWNQVEAQMLLRGTARDIVATLAEMSVQPVPFEYNSIQMSREDVDPMGQAILSARVGFRVLLRQRSPA